MTSCIGHIGAGFAVLHEPSVAHYRHRVNLDSRSTYATRLFDAMCFKTTRHEDAHWNIQKKSSVWPTTAASARNRQLIGQILLPTPFIDSHHSALDEEIEWWLSPCFTSTDIKARASRWCAHDEDTYHAQRIISIIRARFTLTRGALMKYLCRYQNLLLHLWCDEDTALRQKILISTRMTEDAYNNTFLVGTYICGGADFSRLYRAGRSTL